jgi:hypothetical protein
MVTITLFGSSPIGTSDPFFWKKLWFFKHKNWEIFSVNLANFANVLGKVHPIFPIWEKNEIKKKKSLDWDVKKCTCSHTYIYITHEDSSHHTDATTYSFISWYILRMTMIRTLYHTTHHDIHIGLEINFDFEKLREMEGWMKVLYVWINEKLMDRWMDESITCMNEWKMDG